MKITQEMFNVIELAANKASSEIGGILGGFSDGIVADIVTDVPDESERCRFTYKPNVTFLNKKIAEWLQADKQFLGIFHTHFSGYCELSVPDREYIDKIMQAMPEDITYLYFPIYTLPDKVLNVFKAYRQNGSLTVTKDELIIV